MSDPYVDVPSLATDLQALSGGTLAAVKTEISKTLTDLHDQILSALADTPPGNTTGLENQYDLASAWLQSLNDATQPAPVAGADDVLLASMKAVDARTASSAALNGMLVAVNGIVQAAKAGP